MRHQVLGKLELAPRRNRDLLPKSHSGQTLGASPPPPARKRRRQAERGKTLNMSAAAPVAMQPQGPGSPQVPRTLPASHGGLRNSFSRRRRRYLLPRKFLLPVSMFKAPQARTFPGVPEKMVP